MINLLRSFVFLALSASLGVHTTLNTSLSALDITTQETVQGKAAQTLESRFESALPIREFGINFWSALRYVLFNSGDNGVIVGDNGWLFTSEEFYAPVDAADNVAINIKTIAAVNDALAARNIELLVVPVPSKARIHADKVQKIPDAIHRSLYNSLLRFLEGQRIAHVDTLATFSRGDGDYFFKTDTHWLPEAAALTASGLAHLKTAESGGDFTVTNVSHTEHRGDLLNFISLDPWFSDISPTPESLITYEVVTTDSEIDLFAELPAPEVALVGTSYSANSKWNFEGALKLALDEDVVNFATEGEGPIVPMLDFVDNYLPELPELRLVVWEIPERYLAQAYPSRLPQPLPGLALNTSL